MFRSGSSSNPSINETTTDVKIDVQTGLGVPQLHYIEDNGRKNVESVEIQAQGNICLVIYDINYNEKAKLPQILPKDAGENYTTEMHKYKFEIPQNLSGKTLRFGIQNLNLWSATFVQEIILHLKNQQQTPSPPSPSM